MWRIQTKHSANIIRSKTRHWNTARIYGLGFQAQKTTKISLHDLNIKNWFDVETSKTKKSTITSEQNLLALTVKAFHLNGKLGFQPSTWFMFTFWFYAYAYAYAFTMLMPTQLFMIKKYHEFDSYVCYCKFINAISCWSKQSYHWLLYSCSHSFMDCLCLCLLWSYSFIHAISAVGGQCNRFH